MSGLRQAFAVLASLLVIVHAVSNTSCHCGATSGNKKSCCASKNGAGEGTGNFCGSYFQMHHCSEDTPVCCTSDGVARCCKQGSTCSSGCGGGGHGGAGFGSCGCVDPPPVTAACPNPVSLKYGTACLCTSGSCGTIPEPDMTRLSAGNAMVITSEGYPGSITFMGSAYAPLAATTEATQMNLALGPSKKHQTILGFGGAFTDAVAYNYQGVKPATQERFIEQYFGPSGIGYTMGRVNMGSCDFSRMDYTYSSVSMDLNLSSFCLRDDSSEDAPCGSDYKTTVIKAAQDAIAKTGEQRKLKLFASVWSSPTWYKDQHFACTIENGMPVCSPSDANQTAAVQCTREVSNPLTCLTNKQGEPCPTTPLVSAALPGASVSENATVRRLSGLWARASSRATADSAESPALDKALSTKKPNPTDPMDNAHGNCHNSGYLSSDGALQKSWALYFSKFIDAYNELGIDIWGLTVQNEPLATTDLWQSMFYTPQLQASFLANHLGPIMRANHPEVKLMIGDDQTLSLHDFVGVILQDEAAAKYIDGVGYHWYMALQSTFEDTPAQKPFPIGVDQHVGGGAYVRDIVQTLLNQSEDKFMLMTEACNGYTLSTEWVGPRPGEWGYGYSYSHDILWQLRNGASGWTDWNLLLDERGGPNIAGNFVDAPILVKDQDSLYQNPSFFHLAHFAKYVTPGSKRIDMEITCGAKHNEFCQAVAFLTPEGNAVVVMTNDEITVGPIAGAGDSGFCFGGACIPNLGQIIVPLLGKGQGSALTWSISCGGHRVSGEIPWKGIQTVILPCVEQDATFV